MNILYNQNSKLEPVKSSRVSGFTLIEILVVLVIAGVVLSIAIPRIRTVNKERNLREASRVLGSAFANASQRAVIDEVAGVRISRAPNFIQGTRQFAATEVSTLRRVPNFQGDALNAMVTNATLDNVIHIAMPLEQTTLDIVRAGDFISFGTSATKYLITDVRERTAETGAIGSSPLEMRLTLDLAGYLPNPADGSSFTIHRRPRLLRSSTASLPANHIIDLRFSGFSVFDGHTPAVPPSIGCYDVATSMVRTRQLTTVFEPAPTDFAFGVNAVPAQVVENYDIDIIFDEDGAIDFVLYTEVGDEDGDGIEDETVIRRPLGPIYFLVTEAPTSFDLTEETATADENNFWVTISNTSGSVNIGYNNPSPQEPIPGQFVTHKETRLDTLSGYYFNNVDADFNLDDDRDEFNALIDAARTQAISSGSSQ